jgi:hypothetical protein
MACTPFDGCKRLTTALQAPGKAVKSFRDYCDGSEQVGKGGAYSRRLGEGTALTAFYLVVVVVRLVDVRFPSILAFGLRL